jgi:hypothetical protein
MLKFGGSWYIALSISMRGSAALRQRGIGKIDTAAT